MENKPTKIVKSDEQWRQELTSKQYQILRNKGTELPFSGQFVDKHDPGKYLCVACGNELFRSQEKFDSGTGWPSFWVPADSNSIEEQFDRTLWMARVEVVCSHCGGHLGHVFNDGPQPTGLRYCINSAVLKFIPENAKIAADLKAKK